MPDALKILKPDEREIITLCVFSGLKQTEAAEVLDIPYIRLRAKYSYAIKKLKKFYSEGGEPSENR